MPRWFLVRVAPLLTLTVGAAFEFWDRYERLAAALFATAIIGWIGFETSQFQLRYRHPTISAWIPRLCLGALGMLWLLFAFPFLDATGHVLAVTGDDLRAAHIQHRTMGLSELARANGGKIVNKTIEDSTLYGPAVLWGVTDVGIVSDGFFDFSDPDPNIAAFLEVAPYKGQPLPNGVIRVEGTVFRRCRFIDVTLAGTREQIEYWKRTNQVLQP